MWTNIAPDELLQTERPRFEPTAKQDRHGCFAPDSLLVHLEEIIRNEIPIGCSRKQSSDAPSKQIIVTIEHADPRSRRNIECDVPRCARTTVRWQ
jgi:hypothetical protein